MSTRENAKGTNNPSIFVMDYDGSNQTRLTNVDQIDGSDLDPAFSPDGNKIAFERGGEIFVMDDDGSNPDNITDDPANRDRSPDWGRLPGCTLTGTNGDEVLNGTPGYDVICGRGGDDRLRGFGANDRILGGAGNDVLYGGVGDDLVFGQENDDIVNTKDGVEGNDVAVGGSGRDSCRTDPEDRKLSCEP